MNISKVGVNVVQTNPYFQYVQSQNSAHQVNFEANEVPKIDKLLIKNRTLVSDLFGATQADCEAKFPNDRWAKHFYSLLERSINQLQTECENEALKFQDKSVSVLKNILSHAKEVEHRIYDSNYFIHNPLERDFSETEKLLTSWKVSLDRAQVPSERSADNYRTAQYANDYLLAEHNRQYESLTAANSEATPFEQLSSLFKNLSECKDNVKVLKARIDVGSRL